MTNGAASAPVADALVLTMHATEPRLAESQNARGNSARAGAGWRVTLAGQLNASTLPEVWPAVVAPLPSPLDGDVTVDASAVTYCDGAGIGLLVYLNRAAKEAGRSIEFVGLNDDLRKLLDRAIPGERKPIEKPRSTIERLGQSTAAVLGDIKTMIEFLGELTFAFVWAITHIHKVRWRDARLVAEKAGADAIPVVCLLGFLMGVIISFQASPVLAKFGAESMIPTMLAFAMVRELGPLVTAIILAGRSGSAFAAELGTMKVTEEISALTTFGLEPSRFLVVPRMLAAIFVTPLLSVFGTLCGLLGGFLIMLTLGYGLPFYVNQVTQAVNWIDFMQGVFKAGIFAFLVAAVGCLKGLQTKSGPGAVGDSTTRAVVAGIVLIVVADGVLGVVFYFLGI